MEYRAFFAARKLRDARRRTRAFTAGEWRRLAGSTASSPCCTSSAGDSISTIPRTIRRWSASGSSPTCSGCATLSMPITSRPSTTRCGSCCRRASGRWASASSFRWVIRRSCFALALGIIFAATTVKHELPELKNLGGIDRRQRVRHVSPRDRNPQPRRPARHPQAMAPGEDGAAQPRPPGRVARRSAASSIACSAGGCKRLVNHSWQMYPLGMLFGLGFDTASEVGLLAMTAGASAGDLPVGGGAVRCRSCSPPA